MSAKSFKIIFLQWGASVCFIDNARPCVSLYAVLVKASSGGLRGPAESSEGPVTPKNRDSSNSSVRLFSHVTGSRAASRTLFCLLLRCLNHHRLLSKGAWKESLLESNPIFSIVYLKSWTVIPRTVIPSPPLDWNGLKLPAVSFLCFLGDLYWGKYVSLNSKCDIVSFLWFICQHL